ncbi:MAG: hypothetical protein ACRD06_06600 [Terriglobia bacterium]
MARKRRETDFGLALPQSAREKLRRAGIFVQTVVTLEHQCLAHRYVVRGVESGGAVEGFGKYVSFAGEDGSALPYLCRVESLAVNGPHAVVIAPVLVRAEMLRVGNTYELLITRHRLTASGSGRRPTLSSELFFRGAHGYLADGASGLPAFMTRAGEPLPVPKRFIGVALSLTAAVRCSGCEHSHYLVAPKSERPGAESAPETRATLAGTNDLATAIKSPVPEPVI